MTELSICCVVIISYFLLIISSTSPAQVFSRHAAESLLATLKQSQCDLATYLNGAIKFLNDEGTGIVVIFQVDPTANEFSDPLFAYE